MNNEDPYREDLQVIDRELRNHYEYKKQLETVNERIAEIDAQLTSIGSPRIMSPEEAKYQKGTESTVISTCWISSRSRMS